MKKELRGLRRHAVDIGVILKNKSTLEMMENVNKSVRVLSSGAVGKKIAKANGVEDTVTLGRQIEMKNRMKRTEVVATDISICVFRHTPHGFKLSKTWNVALHIQERPQLASETTKSVFLVPYNMYKVPTSPWCLLSVFIVCFLVI
ncbi:hypothetical protein KQX54_001942 [Cotesia glomerata]|uniref:Uncharacterized protein n=1 Tax=Cotesia glomerata TaxID=32391 RepID=A0AAV7IKL6_COTGL|nr:hypothetical protein KQX54_001942 [Cotesia glomerata]